MLKLKALLSMWLLIGALFVLLPAAAMPNYGTPTPATSDAERGEAIFRRGTNGAPPCLSCHALTPGGFAIAPIMAGISERAGRRVEGLDAEEYLHQSIVDPEAYIVPGFRAFMFPGYSDLLSENDIDDLIAFLMTQ